MPAPQITPFSGIPNRQTDSPTEFSAKASIFVSEQANAFLPEANALATAVNDYADAALVSETNAAASALIAATNVISIIATSATSNNVATAGTKTWFTQTGLAFIGGQNIRVSDSVDPVSNYNIGVVIDYITGTGEIQVAVGTAVGIGTFTAWNLTTTSGVITSLDVGTATAGQLIKINESGNAVIGEDIVVPSVSNVATLIKFGAL